MQSDDIKTGEDMKNTKWLALAALMLLAVAGFAQNTSGGSFTGLGISSFPGQAWNVTGNQAPTEGNNVQSTSYVEQGVTVYKSGSFTVTPFVSLMFSKDTKGYDWNNRVLEQGGIKLNKYFKHGIVSVGTAYEYEDRWQSGRKAGNIMGFAQYWFGWQPVADKNSRFPGFTWGAVGNLSPIEHNNLIGITNVEQGYVLHRFGKVAIVPYVNATFSADSQKFDWENKNVIGSGLKAVLPGRHTDAELLAGYLHESRFISGQSAGGFAVQLRLWAGWNPFKKKESK
jgi:hypothetical protein